MKNLAQKIQGWTIMELMIALGFGAIVILGVGLLLADGQRGWNRIYQSAYDEQATRAYGAGEIFKKYVRKACRDQATIAPAGDWVELHYYAGAGSTQVDRFAKFSVREGQIYLQKGTLNPRQIQVSRGLCEQVNQGGFTRNDTSVQMVFMVGAGDQMQQITAAGVMNN